MTAHRHGAEERSHCLMQPADEYDEQYDRDRTRDNNGDGLGAFGGKAHLNLRWSVVQVYGQRRNEARSFVKPRWRLSDGDSTGLFIGGNVGCDVMRTRLAELAVACPRA